MSKNKPRSDGRYQSKVYVGNIDGKPTYKYVYAETNKELQRKILELKSKLGSEGLRGFGKLEKSLGLQL